MPEFEVKEKETLEVHNTIAYEKLKASYELVKSAVLAKTQMTIEDINKAVRFMYDPLLESALPDTVAVMYKNVTQVSTTNGAFAKYNNEAGMLTLGSTFKFRTQSGAGLTSSYIVKMDRLKDTLTIHTRNSVYVYTYARLQLFDDLHFELSADDLKLLERLTLLQEMYYSM